jgi:hypothetical protein
MSSRALPRRSLGTLSGLRAASSRRKRRHLLKMCLGVTSVAASIVVVAVLALEFGKISSLDVESAAARFASSGTAPILIHPETKDCRSKTFDNRTGQIWDNADPCPGTPVDARGVPLPLGTVNTLSSISRSFK